MENVIKQGYLKKGNSTEGGVFSGIIEKMTPRKWYMLVVRSRVPFLEQYERDVDVFSTAPTVCHDLSVCTSISRTMATTPRSFNFVIVCPDQLIELVAATRDQMKDWCDALERTLHSLGILKNVKEEHIYTFCPAVSNLVGHTEDSKEQEEDREDELELGAVGGAPAPLSSRQQQPPPLPTGGHSAGMSRAVSEPPTSLNNLSPPPLPASLPPPLRKQHSAATASPDRTPSPTSSKPPLLPSSPLPPLPASSAPPPLPPGRLSGGSSVSHRPPPLPPSRLSATASNQQEKSLPPEPRQCSPGSSRKPPVKASRGDSEDSESSDTDYSSDFVSGAFWEINRKTPMPSARRAVLPNRSLAGSSNATAASETQSACFPDGRGTDATGAMNLEELDEGYSDLATVSSLWKSNAADPSTRKSDQYAKVMRKSGSAGMSKPEDGTERKELNGQTGDTGDVSPGLDSTELVCDGSPAQRTASVHSEDANGDTGSESRTGVCEPPENFYTPFPVQSDSPAASGSHAVDGSKGQGADRSLLKSVADPNQQTTLSGAFPSENLEQDTIYACASEASSLPPNSVPPLPRRLDSLPSWKDDNSSDAPNGSTAAAACSGSSALGASKAEQVGSRPIPARRKTVHPMSSSGRNADKSSADAMHIPPLPPRRVGRGLSLDITASDSPPPLPARKAQSFRSNRPLLSLSANECGADQTSGSAGAGEGSDLTADRHSTPVHRQQSIGNSDLSENHLRQRMRLDREHSIHSVISLKQSQAEILRQEMELPGVTVTVSARAAQGIAVVDCAEAVCLVGWNQKDFPSLHGKFHIGDQLISVCNIKVTSAAIAHKMLKHPPGDTVEMLVRRTPHALVLAIRRMAEGQNIGIKRNGGTAEIQYVDPNGLAAQNGLPHHAPGVLNGQSRSTWVLTEINSRHLSLFFKDNEIEHRLNAVGREITIVVQPSDYISELKKQLKKLKNYKNYIVQ